MHSCNREIGTYGEDIAENYLKKLGYNIIKRNFYSKIGEIDIIAEENNFICFIEVKTRYSNLYGRPSEAITKHKIYKIFRTAQLYILKNKLYNNNFRFDVIEIMINAKDDNFNINLIKNAF